MLSIYLTYYLMVFEKIITFWMINVYFSVVDLCIEKTTICGFCIIALLLKQLIRKSSLTYLLYHKRQDCLVVGCLGKYSVGSVYCTTSFQHLVLDIALLHVFAWWQFQSKPEQKGKNTLTYLLLFVTKNKCLCLDRQLSHVGGSVLWNHYRL